MDGLDRSELAEPPFVGSGRRAIVDGLVACYDRVWSTGTPLWVSLEAPSGWGKTRVAREFYARLAAERQANPRYWPPSILGSYPPADLQDVSSRRKRVFPRVEHVPGSLPGFIWWGVAASVRNGVPSLALAEDVQQLDAHGPYIDDAWRRLATWTKRHPAWWKNPLGQVAMELAETGVGALIPLPIPGLGLVVPAIQALNTRRKEAAERAQRLVGADTIAAPTTTIVDSTVDLIARVAMPGLPVVIFVEDAHAADAVLTETIGRLVVSESAVLILTTAWHGYVEQSPALGDAFAKAPDRVIRITPETTRLPELFPPGASLDVLEAEDLADVVRAYYPAVDDETLAGLLSRYVSPLALELFCSLPRYRDRFPGGDLRLPPSEIAKLPGSVNDLYRALWVTLPEVVRRSLTYASLGVPAAVAPTGGVDVMWHDGLLRAALADSLAAVDAPVLDALDAEGPKRGWTRVVTAALRQFHEAAQLQTAHEDTDFLWDTDREDFLTILATHLEAALDRDLVHAGTAVPGRDERTHRARLAIALHSHGAASASLYAKGVSSLLQDLGDEPLELPHRVAMAEAWDQAGRPGEAEERISILGAWVDALAEAGRYDAALDMQTELVEYGGATLPVDDARRYAHRRFRAHLLSMVERNGEALEELVAAERDAMEVFDRDSLTVLWMRFARIAITLRTFTTTTELLDEALALADDAERVLGAAHDFTLLAGLAAGQAEAQRGGLEGGLSRLRAAIGAAGSSWGRAHPEVIQSRLILAGLLVAGSPGRARELAHQVADDAMRALGPHSAATLMARGLAAHLDFVEGSGDEDHTALAELRAVVADAHGQWGGDSTITLRLRVLGLEASSYLDPESAERERSALLEAARRLPEQGQAIVALVEALDAARAEPSDPDAEVAGTSLDVLRRRIGTMRSLYGDTPAPEAAAIVLEELIAEHGALSDRTLDAREAYGDALYNARDYSAALREHSRTLFDRIRLHGLDAPGSIQAMSDTAWDLERLGRTIPAARLYELAAASSRALRDRLDRYAISASARAGWAWFVSARWDAAAPVLLDALERRTEALGPAHESTVDVRLGWLRALTQQGRLDDVLVEFPAAVGWAHEGAGAAGASSTRYHHAIALAMAERHAEALPILEAAVVGDPTHRLAWEALGIARHRCGLLPAAATAYRTAAELPEVSPSTERGRPDATFLERAAEAASEGRAWSEELAALSTGDPIPAPDDPTLDAAEWRRQLSALRAEAAEALGEDAGDAEERLARLRDLAVTLCVDVAPLLHRRSDDRGVLWTYRSVLWALGRAERGSGRLREAATSFRLAADIGFDTFGGSGPDVGRSYWAAADSYGDAGHHEEARATAIRAAELFRGIPPVPGTDADGFHQVLLILARSQQALGDREESLATSLERIAFATATWGGSSEQAAWARVLAAQVLKSMARWADLLELAEAAPASAPLDEDHPAAAELVRLRGVARRYLAGGSDQ